MKILKFYTDGRYAVEDIENTLQAMQQEVHGYIEAVPISESYRLIVNEEGKLRDLPANTNATELFRTCLNAPDTIVGDAFVTCVDETGEEFTDMPDKGITAVLASIGLAL